MLPLLTFLISGNGPFAPGPPPLIAPYTTKKLPDASLWTGIIFPVIGPHRMSNDYNENRGRYRHTGVDIAAAKMTPIVAPFSGVLGFKTETFWIYGDNGYFCLGTHLNDDTPGTNDNAAVKAFMFAPNLRKGDRVIAGQWIGFVGDSGEATGPHLHFELFDRNRRITSPWWSLKRAQVLKSPRLALKPLPPQTQEISVNGVVRGVSASKRTVTIQLTSIRKPKQHSQAVTRYRLMALKLGSDVEAYISFPRDREVRFRVKPNPNGTQGIVTFAEPPAI